MAFLALNHATLKVKGRDHVHRQVILGYLEMQTPYSFNSENRILDNISYIDNRKNFVSAILNILELLRDLEVTPSVAVCNLGR